jgi:hypothetical protein
MKRNQITVLLRSTRRVQEFERKKRTLSQTTIVVRYSEISFEGDQMQLRVKTPDQSDSPTSTNQPTNQQRWMKSRS